MVDKRTEKLAHLCVHYSVAIKPKESVVIRGSVQAAPLITEIYKESLLVGAYPWVIPSLYSDYIFFKYAKEHQLKFVSPFDKFVYENMDVSINALAEPNPRRLTNVDSSAIRAFQASRVSLTEIFHDRVARGKLRWTLLPFPITDQAQEASMSLLEYEDFVYDSCLVNTKDPIKEWRKIHKEQESICAVLDKASQIHILGEDTDLAFNVKGRKWVNCSGDKNMPDGEVFTGPIETSANGKIRFTYPGIYMGQEIEDITLTFKKGKVTKATAAKGEELLKQVLKIDGADRLGEVAIGTNYGITKFTKNMLFDEKMGGTIHMALGNAYSQTGATNKSAIHWDLLKSVQKKAEIYADDRLLYKNGRFVKS